MTPGEQVRQDDLEKIKRDAREALGFNDRDVLASHCLVLLAELEQAERERDERQAYIDKLLDALDWKPPADSLVNADPLDEATQLGLVVASLRAAEQREAAWTKLCDDRGLPHDPDGLIRHVENNAALRVAFDQVAAEQREAALVEAARHVAAEAETEVTDGSLALLNELLEAWEQR